MPPPRAFKSATKRIGAKIKIVKPRVAEAKNSRKCSDYPSYLRIYRKTISNLHIREKILRKDAAAKNSGVLSQSTTCSYRRISWIARTPPRVPRSGVLSQYGIGPTLIWTENPDDLAIFTTAESYTNYLSFEAPFSNPRSPKYLPKILRSKAMRMKKGSILIKEETPENAMHIPVHFCAYRIDEAGVFTIFDPSWHSTDAGIYSTTAFYDSLNAFGIPYRHAEPNRAHHWQCVLPNDVFCQTWSLRWLLCDFTRPSIPTRNTFPLPKTRAEAIAQITTYIGEFSQMVLANIDEYMSVFPVYKLEGNDPRKVFYVNSRNPKSVLMSISI
jgi:hypothetical protein